MSSRRLIVIDCEYPSFADYWATFTGGQGIVSTYLMAMSEDCAKRSRSMFVLDIFWGCPMAPAHSP